MREVSGFFQRPLILRGALLWVHELSANMSSLASVSEHSRLAALISAAFMPSQLPQCRHPLRASRFRCMMLAARFKQCALMPLAASPFVDPGRILVITLFLS